MTRHKTSALLLVFLGFALAGCAPAPDRPPSSMDTALIEKSRQELATTPSLLQEQMAGSAGKAPLHAPAPLSLPDDLPEEEGVKKGWAIFDSTPAALSAAAAARGDIYNGNALSCRNCHLDHGTRSSAFPLTNFTDSKRYSPREGLVIDGAQRINACLQRSLNASPLPAQSPELASLIAYLEWIADQGFSTAQEAPSVGDFPDRSADLVTGEALFYTNCAFCHGGDDTNGAPPLWGAQSYGIGADLNRLLVAAAFVGANMPPEGSALSLQEAYDVAAFVNSLERPYQRGLDRDYPALTKKPVDTPYPPHPDSFSQEQHQFGPFGPIIERHKIQSQADRWVFWVEYESPGDQREILTASEPE